MGLRKILLFALLGSILFCSPAWAWYYEGHEVVAIIAADNLTPNARSHVAQILGVPDDMASVAKAMAAASIRPDTEFRKDKSTSPWHWDDAVVAVLETQLETHGPLATANKLEKLYPPGNDRVKWKPAESKQIAWESHQLAEADVYKALGIPERPCDLDSCDPATKTPIVLSPAYMDREGPVAGRQLARAGYRLAALLNQVWSTIKPGHQGQLAQSCPGCRSLAIY